LIYYIVDVHDQDASSSAAYYNRRGFFLVIDFNDRFNNQIKSVSLN